MYGRSDPKVVPLWSDQIPGENPRRLVEPDYVKKLFAAGARASALGIAVLDSEARFELVNESLARETRASVDHHVGKTSHEVVGDLANQIDPAYDRVLSTGEPSSVLLTGTVRNTPEFGYWLDHCFPIRDNSGQVQQLGLFVVNVTAEKASAEIFDALARDSKALMADEAGLLDKFDESVRNYHSVLRRSLEELGSPFTEPPRKAANFRTNMQKLDTEIREMRELIYAVMAQFSIPRC
jgi:hypothetical protein